LLQRSGSFRIIATSLFAYSLLLLAAPSAVPAQQATAAPAPSSTALAGPSISGVVSSERGPLAGVTVAIHGPVTQTYTTQADGTFRFTGIPAGTYRVSAIAPGYEPLRNTIVTTGTDTPQSLVVTLEIASLNSLRVIASTSTTGRGSTAINTSGAAQSTLTSQDYIDRGQFQVQDMLEELPGVELTRASSGGAPGANTDVAVRGASTYETQTLIDGHAITAGSEGTFLIQFLNPLVLGTIEVDKGPGVFGNTIQNAVGGTVNFRTPSISTDLQGRLTSGYDSYNGSTYSARVSDTIGKVGFLAEYGFYGTPGYFTGDILSVTAAGNSVPGQPPPLASVNEAIPAGETFQNRSQVFKLAYNFSPTTSLTLGSIAEQSFVDYTATLDTVEPFTIAPTTGTSFNNPAFDGLIGKTVLASSTEDNLYLGNYEIDNEPIFTADLRTTIGPGSFLGRFFTGSIQRNIDDPQEASQITSCNNVSCSDATLSSAYYQTENDRLRGADFEYSVPFGFSQEDLAQVSYDDHSDRSTACSGGSFDFNSSLDSCDVNNLLLQSRTFSIRAFANVLPKLRVGFANYFSDTTFVGSRYDPRATLVWTPTHNTALRFAVGTAYVAPPSGFVAPVAGETKAVVQNVLDVADALKPETSAGVDIGADFRIHNDSKFTLDVYTTALTNRFSTIKILSSQGGTLGYYKGVPFDSISEVYNASDANESGIEFGYLRAPRVGFGVAADFDLLRAYNYNTVIPQLQPGVSLTGSQTGTIGGDGTETPGFQIPGFPYSHGRAQVSYAFPSKARVALGASIYGANNSFGEAGFTLFDFNTSLPINYGLRLSASVSNIFNHDDYRTLGEYGYGYLPPGENTPYSLYFAPPRQVTLQIIYPFGGR
jgi:outer membrane cobalamin receptor